MRLTLSKNTARAIGMALAAALLAADAWLGFALGWPLALALLAALAGWSAAAYFRQKAASALASHQQALQAERQARAEAEALLPLRGRIEESEREREAEARRARALLAITRAISRVVSDSPSADAAGTDTAASEAAPPNTGDERALMEEALAAISTLTGALGCSFVPVDEWRQPLPPITWGNLPAPVLSAWSQHLASGMLRERCGNCRVLHGTRGACLLHPEEAGAGMGVFCLPMDGAAQEGEGPLEVALPAGREAAARSGVLHLYLPAGRPLEEADRAFLTALLPEIAVAYEAARLRAQEASTLHQLRLLRAPESDFSTSLGGLLAGLRQALEADLVLLRLRPSSDERLSNLTVTHGAQILPDAILDSALDVILRGEAPAASSRAASSRAASSPAVSSPAGVLPAWLALPLLLPDGESSPSSRRSGRVLGMLVAAADRPFIFHPRQQAILQTIAAQAALLVENERMLRSMEYRAVIQERARLAREIHDGLAQTLAFLKLQAAQMQTYLAQGDISRLSRVLKENYQALAEAYLDTRQAIDNLRLTPQDGLESWLERTLREFERSAGLRVERSIAPLDRSLSPEVQAHLIRIVQESLSNVRKHARASTVRVCMCQLGGDLMLEITDDGAGFDVGDVPEISRHGLRGMRERAEMIGADVQIISQPGMGTTVRLTLPAWEEETTP